MSDRSVKRAYSILLGTQPATFTYYPLFTGGVMTVGIVTTPGANVWGVLIDVIGAAAIATEFWLCSLAIPATAGAFGVRELRIANTTIAPLVSVYQARIQVTAISPNLAPIKIPIPIRCNPGAQIQAQSIATNAADTTSVSLLVATGL
jgi:hypothetical protein